MFRLPLLAVLLAACANADELKIEGESKVGPNRLVRLKATGAGRDSALLWRVQPAKDVDKGSIHEVRPVEFEFVAPAGTYTVDLLELSVVDGKPKLRERQATVTVAGPKPTPVDPPTKPDDPKDPAPVDPWVTHFLVIRPDGPAHPSFTQVMLSPAWGELARAGFEYSQVTLTEARSILKVPEGTVLPAVVALKISPDRKKSKKAGEIVALPDNNAALLKLPSIVK